MSNRAEQAANEIYKDGIELFGRRDKNGNLIIHPETMVGILRNACQRGYEQAEKNIKEQMLKDAVEGFVCYGSKGAYIETDFLGEYDTDVYGNPGDKVRIVVLKEEEE